MLPRRAADAAVGAAAAAETTTWAGVAKAQAHYLYIRATHPEATYAALESERAANATAARARLHHRRMRERAVAVAAQTTPPQSRARERRP